MKFYDAQNSVKAGEYLFEKNISLLNSINKITKGNTYYRKITIPEGFTIKQIAALLNNNNFLSGKVKIHNLLEGSLFPDTYYFSRDDNVNSIIERMELKMQKQIQIQLNKNKNIFKNKDDLIRFASLVEAEAKNKKEKFLISSVFHNRIKRGMRLQSDPTVIYGKNIKLKNKSKKIYKDDLKTDNPWNTYTRHGLPKTAICNPGIDSIIAALNPISSNYIYFVSDGEGGHRFSSTLEEHNKNVQIWRKIKKEK